MTHTTYPLSGQEISYVLIKTLKIVSGPKLTLPSNNSSPYVVDNCPTRITLRLAFANTLQEAEPF